MSFQSEAFREFFVGKVGAAQNTANTYNSFLLRMDRALGGLDQAIEKNGIEHVLEWGRTTNVPPFDVRPSHARSVLKRYIGFLIDSKTPTDTLDEPSELMSTETEALEPSGLAFRLEREMQSAVRKQLTNLEEGLVEADGGFERRVSTGSIDIVARDTQGRLVVIELKAGQCPAGAMEQVLGYAEALQDAEPNETVRAILIASEFSDRIRSAARRTTDLKLLRYEFNLRFLEL